jgi:hypothetical protein
MFGPTFVLALAAALFPSELSMRVTQDRCPDVSIVVFRHHPGLIDTKERMEARDQDEKAILNALKKHRISFEYEGGLGSGYELSIHVRDLGRWKTAVDSLIKDGTLKYYDRWGLDKRGYGLIRVH